MQSFFQQSCGLNTEKEMHKNSETPQCRHTHPHCFSPIKHFVYRLQQSAASVCYLFFNNTSLHTLLSLPMINIYKSCETHSSADATEKRWIDCLSLCTCCICLSFISACLRCPIHLNNTAWGLAHIKAAFYSFQCFRITLCREMSCAVLDTFWTALFSLVSKM